MKQIKCLIVGDGTVGKTSLVMTYLLNSFPHDFLPAVFDNYTCSILPKYKNKPFIPQIVDTIALEDYKSHRIVTYQDADVFIICFSLISQVSMQNVETLWIPEIKKNCPNVPYILVGTKSDLRENSTENIITNSIGKKMKNKIGAEKYVECSSLKAYNVTKVFETAFEVGFQRKKKCKS
ncbi:hypothetical protein M9Y10_036729 [Tritrichomonas musculus]|uniref:Uncharacterized protein n=1 Tax=Tritrichomonas musculus TaxID=1915356 RepID=A0ABR2GTM4_9EUKA